MQEQVGYNDNTPEKTVGNQGYSSGKYNPRLLLIFPSSRECQSTG